MTARRGTRCERASSASQAVSCMNQQHYLIDLPITRYSLETRHEIITVKSAKTLREHVERFSRYFLREMHFGSLQFEAAETLESLGFTEYKAYLFAAQDRYIGAACFRYRDDQNETFPWLFDWMWIHPYFRHKGVLSYAWPEFVCEIGQFRIAQPASLHMKQFLSKIDWREPSNSS